MRMTPVTVPIALALRALVLSTACATAAAAVPRDEAMASRFVYCAQVSQFWYDYLGKNSPGSSAIDSYKESRSAFWLAAAIVSDGDYIKGEQEKAFARVVEMLKEEERTGTSVMIAESRSCLETFRKDALPLLKATRDAKE